MWPSMCFAGGGGFCGGAGPTDPHAGGEGSRPCLYGRNQGAPLVPSSSPPRWVGKWQPKIQGNMVTCCEGLELQGIIGKLGSIRGQSKLCPLHKRGMGLLQADLLFRAQCCA